MVLTWLGLGLVCGILFDVSVRPAGDGAPRFRGGGGIPRSVVPTVGEMCSQNVRPFLVDVINLMIIAAWMQSPNTLHVCTNLLLGSLAAVCLFTWRCTDCNHSNASYHG